MRKTKKECAICFTELKDNPIVNVPCGHGFCRKCSDAAIKINKTCSFCRKKIKERVEYFKTYMFVLSYLWNPSHFYFNIFSLWIDSITADSQCELLRVMLNFFWGISVPYANLA